MSGPLEVELLAARLVSSPRTLEMDQQLRDQILATALAEDVADLPCEESAAVLRAVLRAVVAVGSKRVRSAAISALGEVTRDGVLVEERGATANSSQMHNGNVQRTYVEVGFVEVGCLRSPSTSV